MRPRASGPVLLLALATGAGLHGAAPDREALMANGRNVDSLCGKLAAEGRTALEQGNPDGAMQSFDELVRLRASSPFLTGKVLDEHPADAFVRKIETGLLADAVGLKAYGEWRLGMAPAAEKTLASEPGATEAFARYVAEYAADRFAAGQWDDASRAFAAAIEHRLRAVGATFDEECARQQYNRAMAEYNAGRLRAAGELLRELAARRPDYRTDDVRSRIESLAGASSP